MCEYMCVQGKITSVGRVCGGEGDCGGEEGIRVERRGRERSGVDIADVTAFYVG